MSDAKRQRFTWEKCSISLVIPFFSQQNKLVSKEIRAEKCVWNLQACPFPIPIDHNEFHKDYYSIYLCPKEVCFDEIYTRCELNISDGVRSIYYKVSEVTLYAWEAKLENYYGFAYFVDKTWLKNKCSLDALKIKVRIYMDNEEPPNKFAKDWRIMYEKQIHWDVTIVVGNENFKTHRCVLSARSPVFQAMFSHKNAVENVKREIHVEDFDGKTIDAMLRFLYTGEISSNVDFENLLRAASKYCIEDLKSYCCGYLMSLMDANNAISILLLSQQYDCEKLKKYAIHYVTKQNPLAFMKKELFKDIENVYPSLLTELFIAKNENFPNLCMIVE
jgi:hypothetical protein